jgi:hypothetical protein
LEDASKESVGTVVSSDLEATLQDPEFSQDLLLCGAGEAGEPASQDRQKAATQLSTTVSGEYSVAVEAFAAVYEGVLEETFVQTAGATLSDEHEGAVMDPTSAQTVLLLGVDEAGAPASQDWQRLLIESATQQVMAVRRPLAEKFAAHLLSRLRRTGRARCRVVAAAEPAASSRGHDVGPTSTLMMVMC